MRYTPNHSFRLPEMSDPASIGDINFNTNKLDTLLLGSALTVGVYPTQLAASQIQGTDKIAQALSKLEYKTDHVSTFATLNGYTPPTGGRTQPLEATDTVNDAFYKLMVYVLTIQNSLTAKQSKMSIYQSELDSQTIAANARSNYTVEFPSLSVGSEIKAIRAINLVRATGGNTDEYQNVAIQSFTTTNGGTKAQISLLNTGNTEATFKLVVSVLTGKTDA